MRKTLVSMMVLAGLVSGCSSNDSDPVTAPKVAVAVGATADFSAASHAVIDTETPYAAQVNIQPGSNSDVTISGWNGYFYRIERFGANNITKYAAASPDTPIWQCSTEGSESNSNPYQLIQVAENKAYVLRYGSGKLWIVDPSIASSADCASFKTGEIDLSVFDDDGIPEMSAGVVVGNYLFVALQRLQGFQPIQKSQVAVIDITNDSLVDADDAIAGIQPITLPGRNPMSMQYVASLDKIFVQSVGKYDGTAFGGTPAEYTGGIDVIDPTLLTASVLLDDDADLTRQISAMAIIDNDTGYLVRYNGFGDNDLLKFNPATGALEVDGQGTPVVVAGGYQGIDIRGLHAGPGNTLWLRINSGLSIIDGDTDQILAALIDTQMNPSGLVFVDGQ